MSACIGNSFRQQTQKGNFPSKASWLFCCGLFFLFKPFEAANQGPGTVKHVAGNVKAFKHLNVKSEGL